MSSFRNTTSAFSRRYHGTDRVTPSPTTVACVEKAESEVSLPSDWAAYTHPEGQTYFLRHVLPIIVTEAYLYRPDIMSRVAFWVKLLQESLSQQGLVLSGTTEVFLELDDDESSCGYYIIDHATRTQFWMNSVASDELNLPASVSKSHLNLHLGELYWKHVEYFPMHVTGFMPQIINEILPILYHGRADRMTSNCSTFPYTDEQCAQFIGLLESSRSQQLTGHTICYAARLWSVLMNHRFITHYGQEHARLSRDQSILVPSTTESALLNAVSSRLSFGIAGIYRKRLDKLHVDELLYIDQWRLFLPACIEDWKKSISWAFMSLLSSIILLTLPSSYRIIGLSSILTSGASIISGIALLIHHEALTEMESSEAAQYLTDVRSSSLGFMPVASLFSIPRASLLWGFILFLCQAVLMTLPLIPLYFAISAGVFVFALFCVAQWHQWSVRNTATEEPSAFTTLPQFFLSTKVEGDRYDVV